MHRKSKQEQLQQLRFDSFLSSMVQAIPGGPAPNERTEAFEHKKRALEAKLKAEMALAKAQSKR